MILNSDFKELLEELGRGGVEFVVVGGFAVAFHGRPRYTTDIDIFLDGSPSNLERAARALANFGAPPDVAASLAAMAEDEIVFLGQPPRRVDFLRAIDGVSSAEVLADAVEGELDGVRLKVISRAHLIANKRATGRAQDAVDADFLERIGG